MTAEPGADERRIRHLLQTRGVSYAPDTPPPTDGWWDELYDDTHPDHHGPDAPPPPAPRLPDWRRGETADLRGPSPDPDDEPTKPGPTGEWEDAADDEPDTPAPARARRRPTVPAPVRRAADGYAGLPPRTRAALYNGSAAAMGWGLGLEPLIEGWITGCQHDTGHVGTALWFAGGLITAIGVLVDRRTRGWWGPLPWMCRIPLASAILATLLYAPGAAS